MNSSISRAIRCSLVLLISALLVSSCSSSSDSSSDEPQMAAVPSGSNGESVIQVMVLVTMRMKRKQLLRAIRPAVFKMSLMKVQMNQHLEVVKNSLVIKHCRITITRMLPNLLFKTRCSLVLLLQCLRIRPASCGLRWFGVI